MYFHVDDPIVRAPQPGAKVNTLDGFEIGEYVGNPLFTVVDEHVVAAALLVLAPLVIWIAVRFIRMLAGRGVGFAAKCVDAFASASLVRRIATISLWYSAGIHALLIVTHEPGIYSVLYGVGAVLLSLAGWWAVRGRRSRWVVAFTVGSIMTYWLLGAPADQLGLATKLLELFALGLLAFPSGEPTGRMRRLAPAGLAVLIAFTGVAAWIGAFATVGADGGHHGGEYPDPATLVPYIDRLEPNADEEHYAADLYAELLVEMEKYRDPAVAELAGYNVGTVTGTDHHAQNPSLIGDGRILDPAYPESLIYAETTEGPVLVGVMFEMDGFQDRGPTDGGPLMLWHAHENVCFGVLPPALAGLESPFGMCPMGSVNIPRTGEMLHAWIMPGVPVEDQWGHVDEEWYEDYLATYAHRLVDGG
jgi:hypothetical protein